MELQQIDPIGFQPAQSLLESSGYLFGSTTADSVKAGWPKEKLVTKLKASFTFCETAFEQLNDAKLGEQVTMSFRGQSRTIPRATMVLGHALDMADHYSQIANYMRLNGLIPPTALPRPKQ